MEVEQVLFQSAQDQGVICAALKSTLDLFADDEILGIKNGSVDELERALPVCLGILVRRLLRDQHRMHPALRRPSDGAFRAAKSAVAFGIGVAL
jgi:hypothetical protein